MYVTTGLLMIAYLSLCKLETSCSCFLSCVTIFSHSALASWYCSSARASRSSAFCRASFSFSRSASALSRSVVSIDLIAFVYIFLMSFFLAGALHCGHLSFPPLAFNHLSIQLQERNQNIMKWLQGFQWSAFYNFIWLITCLLATGTYQYVHVY